MFHTFEHAEPGETKETTVEKYGKMAASCVGKRISYVSKAESPTNNWSFEQSGDVLLTLPRIFQAYLERNHVIHQLLRL